MKEMVKIYSDKTEAQQDINYYLSQNYYIVDFKMKLSHGGYGGQSSLAPRCEERYYVHLRKVE